MVNSRNVTAFSLLGLLAMILSVGVGALGMYAFEENRYRDLKALAASGQFTSGGVVAPSDETARAAVDRVYQLVNERSYYRPLDPKELWYGAAEGMARKVGDDYTMFLPPVETEAVASELQGNFEGVGIYVEMRDDRLTVVNPIPSTPAERAGLRARDIIALVDGRDISGIPLNQVIYLIRGPEGTKVRLTIIRGNQAPFDVELTRAKIDVPACTTTLRDDGIAVIACSVFGDKTTEDLDAGLKQATDAHAKGVILDLRNNGGGYVDAAEEMIGRFVPSSKGPAFYEAHTADDPNPTPNQIKDPPRGGPRWQDGPLVVLVNGGTASASEIVSGAIQDYGRAPLLGEQTFGKGSEQSVTTLPDQSSVRVTIAHWLTPNKRDINPKPTPTLGPGATPPPLPTLTATPEGGIPTPLPGVTVTPTPRPVLRDRGLTPDIEVLRTPEDYQADRDPQLDQAVQYLLTGK